MPINDDARSIAAIRRKLRALAAVLTDPAATENERANARTLRQRLQERLPPQAAPSEGTWSGLMFRLGRGVKQAKELHQSSAPPAPKGDWTDSAFRLGRMLRRGLKK